MFKYHIPKLLWKFFQIFVCEAIGAGILCLPCFLLPVPTTSTDIVTPMAFGISVYMGLWITGATSGGHTNPMITLAAAVTRRVPLTHVPVYLVGQFVGSLISASIAWWVNPLTSTLPNTYGLTIPGAGVATGAALVLEMVTTFNLILVLLASLDEVRDPTWQLQTGNNFPFAMMIAVTANIALTGSISGGSMNPTRSIAPAIIQGNFDRQWIYFVGPPVGCIVACFVYEMMICPFSSLLRTRMWLTSRDFDRKNKYMEEAEERIDQASGAL